MTASNTRSHQDPSATTSVSFATRESFLSTPTFYRQEPLLVKLLSENAELPKRATALASGLDLFSAKTMTIPKGDRALVPTDLSLCCPPGTYGRVAPRSGLALRYGIDVGAGVIDADYRGPVGVILFNWGLGDFEVKRGDRIAQLILEQIISPIVFECIADLPGSARGDGGFGSTGVGRVEDE